MSGMGGQVRLYVAAVSALALHCFYQKPQEVKKESKKQCW
jgi:hypothetical protein